MVASVVVYKKEDYYTAVAAYSLAIVTQRIITRQRASVGSLKTLAGT